MLFAGPRLPTTWTAEAEKDVLAQLRRLPLLRLGAVAEGRPTPPEPPQSRIQLGNVEGAWEDLQAFLAKGQQAVDIAQKAEPYLPTIEAVLEDPALPQVVERVNKLRTLEQEAAAKAGAPPEAKVGIGLRRVVKPLDAYIYTRKHPWVPWVAGAGAVLLLAGIGFGVGRVTARSAAAGFGAADAKRRSKGRK